MTTDKSEAEHRKDVALAKLQHYAQHLSCVYGDDKGEEGIDHFLHCCDWAEVVEICVAAHKRVWPPIDDAEAVAIASAYYPHPVEPERWNAALDFAKLAVRTMTQRGWSPPKWAGKP